MDAFDVVDGLRHMQIGCQAAQRIGFVLRYSFHIDDPADHFFQCHARGIVKVGIEAEGDEVGRRFGARQPPAEILADMELECAGQGGLNRSAIDLAVALGGVAVAGREQRALIPHRQIDGAASGELLTVDVTPELARLLAVLPPEILGRGHCELTEERRHRHLEARRQDRLVARLVEPDVDELVVGEVLRQRTAVRAEQIEAPVLAQHDVVDLYLEHVADGGSANEDRPGEDVVAGAALHALMDVLQLRQDLEAAPLRRHPFRIARHALDHDDVAGIDGQHRLERGIEEAPVNRVGARLEQMRVHAPLPGMTPLVSEKQYFAISPARVNQTRSLYLCSTQCLMAWRSGRSRNGWPTMKPCSASAKTSGWRSEASTISSN